MQLGGCQWSGGIQLHLSETFRGSRDEWTNSTCSKSLSLLSEPGFYLDGQFGIRLETIMEVVKAQTPVSLQDCILVCKWLKTQDSIFAASQTGLPSGQSKIAFSIGLEECSFWHFIQWHWCRLSPDWSTIGSCSQITFVSGFHCFCPPPFAVMFWIQVSMQIVWEYFAVLILLTHSQIPVVRTDNGPILSRSKTTCPVLRSSKFGFGHSTSTENRKPVGWPKDLFVLQSFEAVFLFTETVVEFIQQKMRGGSGSAFIQGGKIKSLWLADLTDSTNPRHSSVWVLHCCSQSHQLVSHIVFHPTFVLFLQCLPRLLPITSLVRNVFLYEMYL